MGTVGPINVVNTKPLWSTQKHAIGQDGGNGERWTDEKMARTSTNPLILTEWTSWQIRKTSPPRVRDPDMHHGTCVTHVP